MEEKDVEAVARMEQRVFSDPWDIDSFYSVVRSKDDIYVVAVCENGEILGYCGLWGVVGEGQVMNVCVHPEYRGLNIGRSMLNELISQGIKAGLSSFTLEARASNHAAINLYKSLGFVEYGIRGDFYSHPKEDALVMWLEVAM